MKLEILTPTHIGSGDKYLALDFVIDRNRVVFIDSTKFFGEVEKMGLDAVEVAGKIGEGRSSVTDYIKDISAVKLSEIPFIGGMRRKEIIMQIKTNGKPYIPGSSIKGAIRTAILWKTVKDDRKLLDFAIKGIKNVIQYYEKRKRRIPAKELKKLDDKLEEKVFRKANLTKKSNDPKNDLLRALRVSDTTFFSRCSVYQINFLGMRNFSVLAECIDPEQTAELEGDIDEFALSYLKQRLDFDYISSAAREFAEEIVKFETMRRYPNEVKHEFRNVLKAKGIVLRVGWGIGWYSTTIGTLLKTHPEFESIRKKLGLGRNPKTKGFSKNFPTIGRYTYDNKPLGWIVLR